MSYEGYEIYLCEQGHRWGRDVYSPDVPACPHCKGPRVWQCSVDQTNYDEQEPELKVAEPASTCSECGQTTGPVRYVVPEGAGKAVPVEQHKASGLDCLIMALAILSKYDSKRAHAPTNCEHDVFRVHVEDGDKVTPEDAEALEDLGFHWDGDDLGCWYSYRFGSC